MNEIPGAKAEIGSKLRSARLKKGLTVDVISQHTRIPKKFLEALEENRFDELPATAYLRGFLKSYCEYLEMDFDPLWQLVLQEISPTPPAGAPAAEGSANGDAAKPAARPASPAVEPAAKSSDVKISAAVFILFLLAAILVFLWAFHKQKKTPPAPAAPALPTALEPVHKNVEPHLLIEFRDDAWVSLKIDGRPQFEGRVPRNSKQEWTARKTISLLTPTPRKLKLTLNGNRYDLPAPGAAGYYNIETP